MGGATLPRMPPRPPAIPSAKKTELADLPAPKRQSPLSGLEGGKPVPKTGLDMADLPAPKAPAPNALPDLDLSWGQDDATADLPAPKPKAGAAAKTVLEALDLPAPKPKAAPPARGGDLSEVLDLPAPKAKPSPPAFGGAVTVPLDLPAPKAGGAKPPAFKPTPTLDAGLDLPAPKPRASPLPTSVQADAGDDLDIIDLPAPKTSGLSDLPKPKAGPPTILASAALEPLGIIDLPAPKGISDLPAPKGISDLLTPKPGANLDLPAPKGFFDDLPQSAGSDRQAGGDQIAPKGFFDDLPQPAKPGHASPAAGGFFDDLPAPAGPAVSAAPTAPPVAAAFFDDDLAPPLTKSSPTPSGVFDDLPEPQARSAGQELDLELSAAGATTPEPPADDDLGKLDLELPTPSNAFADLDLSAPSPPPAAKANITIKSPTGAPGPKPADQVIEALPRVGGELRLELEGETPAVPQFHSPKEREPKKAPAVGAAAPAAKPKRKAMLIGGAAAAVVLTLGGGFFYQRHTAKQERAAALSEHLDAARAAIRSDHPDHWNQAATAAAAALKVDERNVTAIGLRAEALIAGALDTGISGESRISQGQSQLRDALSKNLTGPALETAQALGQIAANQADRSVAKLEETLKREPNNGFLHLYLGWARAAMGDPTKAIGSFTAAITADAKTKPSALYARGRAKLQLLDFDGAKADFAEVLATAKDHIGAQVGFAASQPPSQSSQREADLLAVLARKDIASGDPRAVVQAWTLAADVARVGDRLDVARERYRQALALAKGDLAALIGLARVELRDGKLAAAADLVQKALGQRADDLEAMLVAAELSVRQGKIDDANAITAKLAKRVPPLLPLQRARLQLVIGQALEAQTKDTEAIDAWVEGAKAAGDLDLSPMMAAVTKLSTLAKKATESRDDQKAADYRARADELLSSLADRAQNDAYLSRTLGGAYLVAGDPAKAEQLLRRAVEIRGSDIDSRLAFAKALAILNRADDAIGQLHAAQKLDPTRLDISLELARTLETARRDADAAEEYVKLIEQKEAPLQARIHAGKFLARRGDFKRAGEQAEIILRAEPENAAGHYLRGEGLMANKKFDDARKALTLAVDTDPDPQYLDAQGRAAEASVESTSDTKYYDLALRAYERAIDAAPTMINPQAGTGRVYVARKQWSKAAAPLAAAIKLDPKNTEVMYNLGVTYKNLGHVAEGIEWLELAIRTKPDPDAYWQLAQLYQDMNRGRDTANALRQATRLAREKETTEGTKIEWLTEAWYRLGETELGLHNDAAARAAYETYIGRNPPAGAQLTEARRLLSSSLR